MKRRTKSTTSSSASQLTRSGDVGKKTQQSALCLRPPPPPPRAAIAAAIAALGVLPPNIESPPVRLARRPGCEGRRLPPGLGVAFPLRPRTFGDEATWMVSSSSSSLPFVTRNDHCCTRAFIAVERAHCTERRRTSSMWPGPAVRRAGSVRGTTATLLSWGGVVLGCG